MWKRPFPLQHVACHSGSTNLPFTLKVLVSTCTPEYGWPPPTETRVLALGDNRLSSFGHHAQVARLQLEPHLLRGARLQMNPLEAAQRPHRRAGHLRESSR